MEFLIGLLFLMIIPCLIKLSSLGARVALLENELQSLLQGASDAQEAEIAPGLAPDAPTPNLPHYQQRAASSASAVQPSVVVPQEQPVQPVQSWPRARAVQPQPAVQFMATPVAVAPRQPRKPVFAPILQKLRTTDEWEALIGGRWLNRIGALALILGMGFFLKYAVDQNWINAWERVSVGVVVGVGLTALSMRTHQKGFKIFAQGLAGAGVSCLYLSVYASFNFYHLISQPVALAGMAAVTVLAFAQAIQYDSRAVSLLAWAGGFLTPVLISSQYVRPTELGLFGYLILLDAGILAVLVKRPSWRLLEPLTVVATYGVYLLWYSRSYQSAHLLETAVYMAILWSLFYVYDVYRMWTRADSTPWTLGTRHALGVFNAVVFYLVLFQLIASDHQTSMAIVTLTLGVVYAGTLAVAMRRGLDDVTMAVRHSLTAIVLLVVATAILASGFAGVTLWAMEALILLAAGVWWKRWYVWQPALALFALAALRLTFDPGSFAYSPLRSFTPVLNARFLAFAVLAAAMAVAAVLMRRLPDKGVDIIRSVLQYAWTITVFLLLVVETNDYFERQLIGATGVITFHCEDR